MCMRKCSVYVKMGNFEKDMWMIVTLFHKKIENSTHLENL